MKEKIKFITKQALQGVYLFFKFIFVCFMMLLDYILSIHSETGTASWKRWACTVLLVILTICLYKGMKSTLLNGQMLSDILKTIVMSIAGIYGAGVLASGIANAGSGSSNGSSFSIVEKFKSFFFKKQ